jgi:hypothetical protein
MILLLIFLAAIITGGLIWTVQSIQTSTEQAMRPVEEANQTIKTQMAHFTNVTPTIVPDPITIVHEIRSLARLETIQYSVEKVVVAEKGQDELKVLFGDKLLLVAHGTIIAGIDLNKVDGNDFWLQGKILHMRLPAPEIFVATLDNEKSYVYDRQTGLLTKGDPGLEGEARRVAEGAIMKAALDDGVLKQARQNAENYLARLLRSLGYPDVIFEGDASPEATLTPTP